MNRVSFCFSSSLSIALMCSLCYYCCMLKLFWMQIDEPMQEGYNSGCRCREYRWYVLKNKKMSEAIRRRCDCCRLMKLLRVEDDWRCGLLKMIAKYAEEFRESYDIFWWVCEFWIADLQREDWEVSFWYFCGDSSNRWRMIVKVSVLQFFSNFLWIMVSRWIIFPYSVPPLSICDLPSAYAVNSIYIMLMVCWLGG